MIRLARNEDGKRLEELASKQVGKGLDWSNVYPYWLVAEKEGKIIGCLSVALGKPVGRLDILALDDSLSPHSRSRAVRGLILQGMATLKADGSTACLSVVPFKLKAYKRILKKHFDVEVAGQGNMIIKRL
ncbi:MAG: hypothetical protein ABUK15_07315 [Anaerolineales bacterium]